MSFFLCACRMELLALLRNRRFAAVLLLMLMGVLLLSALIPGEELTPAVPVGWAMPEDCRYGAELLSLLRGGEGFVEFISADEAELRANVASGKWACGFVLREDFDLRVEKARWSRLFTLVHAGDEALPALVSEAVSSAMLVMVSQSIGGDYLAAQGVEVPEEGWILEEALRLKIEPVHDGELGLDPVARGFGERLVHGAAGILLLMLSLSMGDGLARRRKEPDYLRMAAVRGESAMLSAALLCRGGLMLLICLAAGAELLCAAAFCLCLMGLMSLLWALPWGWSAQVLPFLPVALLVLCPVLFDVSAFMPQLKPLCGIIPVTYYLRGDALPNLLLGGLFLLLGMGINKMKK